MKFERLTRKQGLIIGFKRQMGNKEHFILTAFLSFALGLAVLFYIYG